MWKAYDKINRKYGVKLSNLEYPYIGRQGNTIIRAFAATKDAKGDNKLLKELNKYSNNNLEDAPSNAPKPPEEEKLSLTREILIDLFNKFGFS